MNISDAWRMVLDLVTQHIPTHIAWVPLVALILTGLFGLTLLSQGARLARSMVALFLAGFGGLAGQALGEAIGTPVWPTAGCGAIAGLFLGFVLFRFWLSGLVGACFIGAGLTTYGLLVLQPHLAQYTTQNLDAENSLVTLPPAGAVVGQDKTPLAELGRLGDYLQQRIPSLPLSLWIIILGAGLIGVACGWLLPRLSRALWAATVGTLLLGIATTGLLESLWPAALAWLNSLGSWGWGIIGVIWSAALFHNLLACRAKAARPSAAAKPAPSLLAKAIGA